MLLIGSARLMIDCEFMSNETLRELVLNLLGWFDGRTLFIPKRKLRAPTNASCWALVKAETNPYTPAILPLKKSMGEVFGKAPDPKKLADEKLFEVFWVPVMFSNVQLLLTLAKPFTSKSTE